MPPLDTADDATGDPRKSRRYLDAPADASGSPGDEYMGVNFDELFPTRAVDITTNRHAQKVRLYGAWAAITPTVGTCGYLLITDRPYHAALMFIGTALLVGLGILLNPPLITIRPASDGQQIVSARPGEWGSPEDYQSRPWAPGRNRQDRQTNSEE